MEKSFLLLNACFVILFFSCCVPKPPATNGLQEYRPLKAINQLSLFKVLQNVNIQNEDTFRFDKREWRDFKDLNIVRVKLISVSLNAPNYNPPNFTALIGIKTDGSNTEKLLLPCPPYCPKSREEPITLREIKQEMNQN